ncbi:MAG: polysaccharide deacetylase family protein [Clostridia bacterium]|nr:polysaccharide deacetylase family protein [Clostridia bacterium]
MLIFITIMIILIFMIYAFIPSYLNKKIFFNKKNKKEKVIYLTFDDGPSEYTEELLNLLNKYNIKATFFCVANFAKKYKSIIYKMKKDGHVIALHSLKHKNSMLQGINETKLDLEESLNIMNELLIKIQYYRPPWGDTNLYLLKKLEKENIKLILWNVMAEDWRKDTTEEIIANKLLTRVKDGDIICLHDGRGKNEAPLKTIKALKKVIPIFLEKGYIFKTIEEYET